jgi:hypothetical protein
MAILGVLLLLGVVGATAAVAWANQDAMTASAGTLNVFGEQVSLNVGQMFLAGAVMGGLALLALSVTIGGTRRRMARTATRRRELRDRERELQARLAEANATTSARQTAREERAADRAEAAAHR